MGKQQRTLKFHVGQEVSPKPLWRLNGEPVVLEIAEIDLYELINPGYKNKRIYKLKNPITGEMIPDHIWAEDWLESAESGMSLFIEAALKL